MPLLNLQKNQIFKNFEIQRPKTKIIHTRSTKLFIFTTRHFNYNNKEKFQAKCELAMKPGFVKLPHRTQNRKFGKILQKIRETS